MKWTEEQNSAIESRKKNLLVAAAAGSGKTAVLVERIVKMIVEGLCEADEILVMTFTNAAAAEMRTRIHKAITKKMHEETEPKIIERDENRVDLIYEIDEGGTFQKSSLIRNFAPATRTNWKF